MPRILAVFLIALALVACSDRPKPPPQATGEWFRINPDRWPSPPALAEAQQP